MRRRPSPSARKQPQVPQERHVTLHKSHTNAVPESHVEPQIQPNQNNSDLPYDTVLDFGDGDALNLNDSTYEDPSPSSRTTASHDDDDEDFPVAHRDNDFESDPDTIDSRIAKDMPSSDYITDPDMNDESDNKEDEEPSDDSDEDTEEEPLPESEPAEDEESNGSKDKPQQSWLQGIKDKIKNEIGVPDENEEPDQQETKTIPQLPSAEKPQPHTNGHTNAKGLSNIVLTPVHMVMSTIRGLSKILRIILSLSGLVVLIVIAWLIFNIIPAVSNTSAQYTHDEGNASVSSLSYANNKVSFSVDNESDMIAHISASASVKAWKPSISHISSIINPVDVMSCQPQSVDLMPKESKNMILQCNGESGIWMRPIVKVNNQ
jgi:competence protein ComGC